MAGQFNEAVIDFTEAFLKENGTPLERTHFWVAGFKTAAHAEERFGGYDQFFTLPSSAKTLVNTVQDVLLRFEKRRRERGESRFLVVHNSPLPGASYTQRGHTLLPPDERWLKEMGSRRWPRRGLPFYRLEWPELFSFLIGEYLFISLFRAFAASMAAENAARLSSMQRAESNIEDQRADLVSRYHSLRQNTVDEELFDVVSGFEALSASG
jgi:F-type H+-transporting ATPase subunit gamma